MNLVQALRLSSAPKLVLVGSGGKTTALFKIADQLPKPVLVTTTTHLSVEQTFFADQHHCIESIDDLKQLDREMPEAVLLLTGRQTGESRISGLHPSIMQSLIRLAHRRKIALLVEADGAQKLPLKAPAVHEPAIFPEIWKQDFSDEKQTEAVKKSRQTLLDVVIVVSGLSGIGKPLTAAWVHRPQEFSRISGINEGDPVSIFGLRNVLIHPQGGLKNIPPGVRRVALLNQFDRLDNKFHTRQLADELINSFDAAIISSLGGAANKSKGGYKDINSTFEPEIAGVYEPVAGIILAAGGSQRMGKPKQLLNWRGQSLIRHVVTNALQANFSPLIVILGAYLEQIKNEIEDLPVRVVNNENWQQGQSTSLHVGIDALPKRVGSAVFILADQPMIAPSLLRSLVDMHAKTLAPFVAPIFFEKRGNPVLFDRDAFSDLKKIHGDIGGRALFDRYQ
ncbi:MAG: selenium cofactor biosynthesis protein YqeC, partial [Anaerolineales bacterium]